MPLLDKLERRLGRGAIPHLTLYLVIGQVFVFLSALLQLVDLNYFVLVAARVERGEWYRLITFVFMPPALPQSLIGYVFIAFTWYLFYLMGSALEGLWGEFRFNLFMLTGYALTVAVAFITPRAATTNLFIGGSVFLAFARLNPDFELTLFFILPVKIKWLALLAWLGALYYLVVGDPALRLQIGAAVGNYLLFFGGDIVRSMRHRQRAMTQQTRRMTTADDEPEARHRCSTCGQTNLTDPQMDFRYCSKCAGDLCYCADHIFAHDHVRPTSDAAKNNPLVGAVRCVTLGDWLTLAEKLYARQKLAFGQVSETAHDEALYLLLRTLGLSLDSDARVLRKKLTVAERAKVEQMLRRRAVERVPAAYLTREAWLGGQQFYVDERVIIPRSYFVEIIPQQLDSWLHDPTKVRRVADVCTGSGCLAILLAQHFPRANVEAIDLSPGALEVARINVQHHQLVARVALFCSDVFADVPAAKYDVIVSNPPYEPSGHVDAQTPEFKAEPRMAHDGGEDGLVIIRRLLRQARTRLTPQGIVLVEVGALQAAMDREFAMLEPHWLRTEDGANCVGLIHAARLKAWRG